MPEQLPGDPAQASIIIVRLGSFAQHSHPLPACRLAKDFVSGLVLPMQVETVLAQIDTYQRCRTHDDGLQK